MGNSISKGEAGGGDTTESPPLTPINYNFPNSILFSYFGDLVTNEVFTKICQSVSSLSETMDFVLIFKVTDPFNTKSLPSRFSNIVKIISGNKYQIIASTYDGPIDDNGYSFKNRILYLADTGEINDLRLMSEKLVPFLSTYKTTQLKIFQEIEPVSTVHMSPNPRYQIKPTALDSQYFLVHCPINTLENALSHLESIKGKNNICCVYTGLTKLDSSKLKRFKYELSEYSKNSSVPVTSTSSYIVVNSSSATSFKSKIFSVETATPIAKSVAHIINGKIKILSETQAVDIQSYVVNRDTAIELFVSLPALSWTTNIPFDFTYFTLNNSQLKILAVLLNNKTLQPKRFVIKMEYKISSELKEEINNHMYIHHVSWGGIDFLHNAHIRNNEILTMFPDRPLAISLGTTPNDITLTPNFSANNINVVRSNINPLLGLGKLTNVAFVEVPFVAIPEQMSASKTYVLFSDTSRVELLTPLVRQLVSRYMTFVFLAKVQIPGISNGKEGNYYAHRNHADFTKASGLGYSEFTITHNSQTHNVVVSETSGTFTKKDVVIYTGNAPSSATSGHNGKKFIIDEDKIRYFTWFKDVMCFEFEPNVAFEPKISPDDLIELMNTTRVSVLSPMMKDVCTAIDKFMKDYINTNNNRFTLIMPVPNDFTDSIDIEGLKLKVYHGPLTKVEASPNSAVITHSGIEVPPFAICPSVLSTAVVSQAIPRNNDTLFDISLPYDQKTDFDAFATTPFGLSGTSIVYTTPPTPITEKMVMGVNPTVLHFSGPIRDFLHVIKSINTGFFPAQTKVLMIFKIIQKSIRWTDAFDRTLKYFKDISMTPEITGGYIASEDTLVFSNQKIGIQQNKIVFTNLLINLGPVEFNTVTIDPTTGNVDADPSSVHVTTKQIVVGRSMLSRHEIVRDDLGLVISGAITKLLGIYSVVYLVNVSDSEIKILSKLMTTSEDAHRLTIVIRSTNTPNDYVKALEGVHIRNKYIIISHSSNTITTLAKLDYVHVNVVTPGGYYYKFGVAESNPAFKGNYLKEKAIDFLINTSNGENLGKFAKIMLNERVNISKGFVLFNNASKQSTPIIEGFNNDPDCVMFLRDVTLTSVFQKYPNGIIFAAKIGGPTDDNIWFEMVHQIYVKYQPIGVVIFNEVIKKADHMKLPSVTIHSGEPINPTDVLIVHPYAFYPTPKIQSSARRSYQFIANTTPITIETAPITGEIGITKDGFANDALGGTSNISVLHSALLYSMSRYRVSYIKVKN